MRNLSTKVNDSAPANTGYIDASEFNSTQDELENATTSAPGGLVLDASTGPDSSTSMLAQSITRHAAGGAIYCTATGSASSHVVLMADANVTAPTVLFKGLTCRYDPPAANATSAVVVNAFSLGSKALVNHVSAPLSSTEIDGRVIDIFYDPTIGSGSWVLPAWSNALFVGQTPSSPPSVSSGEGVEVDGSNLANLNFSGLSSATPVTTDTFAFLDATDSTHKTAALSTLGGLFTSGGLLGVQWITTSSTYTKTSGTNNVLVFATGGGGGGIGGTINYGSGGAGATAIAYADISGVSTVAATIGAGGAPGVGGGSGSAGGSTSFGSHATAGGGGGATLHSLGGSTESLGGLGGVATVGLVKLVGQGGSSVVHGGGATGGASFWGGGGAGGNYNGSRTSGADGGAPGGGGGGGDGGNVLSSTGGAGAAGAILVLEFA